LLGYAYYHAFVGPIKLQTEEEVLREEAGEFPLGLKGGLNFDAKEDPGVAAPQKKQQKARGPSGQDASWSARAEFARFLLLMVRLSSSCFCLIRKLLMTGRPRARQVKTLSFRPPRPCQQAHWAHIMRILACGVGS
jgi:hypothetical protein